MVEVASEKSSTVILPFPVELLRFLENSSHSNATQAAADRDAARERASARNTLRTEEESKQLAAAEDLPPAIAPMPEIPEVDLPAEPTVPEADAHPPTAPEMTEEQLEAELGSRGK
jgi:hypothetical protein